jgi:hypothetical protein
MVLEDTAPGELRSEGSDRLACIEAISERVSVVRFLLWSVRVAKKDFGQREIRIAVHPHRSDPSLPVWRVLGNATSSGLQISLNLCIIVVLIFEQSVTGNRTSSMPANKKSIHPSKNTVKPETTNPISYIDHSSQTPDSHNHSCIPQSTESGVQT